MARSSGGWAWRYCLPKTTRNVVQSSEPRAWGVSQDGLTSFRRSWGFL